MEVSKGELSHKGVNRLSKNTKHFYIIEDRRKGTGVDF